MTDPLSYFWYLWSIKLEYIVHSSPRGICIQNFKAHLLLFMYSMLFCLLPQATAKTLYKTTTNSSALLHTASRRMPCMWMPLLQMQNKKAIKYISSSCFMFTLGSSANRCQHSVKPQWLAPEPTAVAGHSLLPPTNMYVSGRLLPMLKCTSHTEGHISFVVFVNNDMPCHSDILRANTMLMCISVTASAWRTTRPFYSCQELTAISPAYTSALLAYTVRKSGEATAPYLYLSPQLMSPL